MDSADAEGEEGEEAEEGEKGKGGEETAPIKRKKKKADPNTAKGKKQVRWDSVGIPLGFRWDRHKMLGTFGLYH